MEVSILEEKKNRILVEVKGEGHAFCNALRKELWNDKHVKAAAYKIEHPLTGIPKLLVETDGDEKPMAALEKAAQRLKENIKKIKSGFVKEVK